MGEYSPVRRCYTFADGSFIRLITSTPQGISSISGLYFDMVMIQEFVGKADAETLRALIRNPMK